MSPSRQRSGSSRRQRSGSPWRQRLGEFDRDVLTPAPQERGHGPRYAPFADTYRLPLVAGAVLAAVLTVLELALVQRPLGTVAFLLAGLVVGAVVGTVSARTAARRHRDAEPAPSGAEVVPQTTPPRVLAAVVLVGALLCVLPAVLDFPTPVGPFAAAVAVQAFLERRAVRSVEAERGARLLAPADGLTVEDDSLRWGPTSAS